MCRNASSLPILSRTKELGIRAHDPNPLIHIIAGLERISLQHVKISAVIDMIGLPVEHQRGHRLHAGGFRLGDPAFLFGQMHDFHRVFRRIQRIGDVLFRVNGVSPWNSIFGIDSGPWFVWDAAWRGRRGSSIRERFIT